MSEDTEDDVLTPHEIGLVRELIRDAHLHKRAAQLVRDYDAYGRAGGFVFTCAKWVAAIAAAVILIRSGMLAFLAPG